ncbi:MAG: Na(+)/H(+) antiporter subunit D [Gammaproteobacteria bacterium]|nr:Na(+)/H(+) antiporter subunit D [Rhodocyclaceae bacterium]MBU3909375.1 Na(+)/H(+) antiporter subunit D [Gammaproteobacteria bacterium]MBU3990196.1 Na(+)/H(+) antiporter subunit D [Gammaproteobacteria bacterium]MBU4005465.1 Na(+)/H(+) antiporter subunit D [Gammaproteobacteria bacterium]MBU4020982.1 Na(+)/H(+) antiporter subunit D [Gammaproteobacteria bacterium]
MSSALILHPALILIAGALLLPFLRGTARSIAVLAAPTFALIALWLLPEGRLWEVAWLDYQLAPLAVDKLSRLFATIFALMAFAGGLFALRQESRLEMPAAFLYAGAAIGVALAGDLVTVFVFWEVMAVGSTLVLWSANTKTAWAASLRYAMVHLGGGVILFAGVTGHLLTTGDATFTRMQPDSIAHWLILIGFLINAGAPPLSAWLPDAYPEASWSGTVFLSAFTTKTAVYVLLRGFPGTEILIWVGLFMVFYGIVYALLENDMRRILAYSIINQVGFMIAGIGIGTEMALNGAAAHAFTHIIYKALLLMSAGAVLAATGRRKCSELGGLFHSMPIATICGTIGALAISSFPLTSGFISKSMISQAAADGHLQAVWLLLAAASAGVFLHAGIKFPWFVFFQKDSGLRPPDASGSMRWAMILFAFLCIALGVWPEPLYAILPYAVDYVPYTTAHVLTQLQLLLFSGLAFFVMLNYLKRTPTISLDVDWLYRKPLPGLARRLGTLLHGAMNAMERGVSGTLTGLADRLDAQRGPRGLLAKSWPTGSMALWVMVMLLAYLLFYYLG